MIVQLLFLFALAQINNAYVHDGNYAGYGEMKPEYAYVLGEDEENSNRGTYWVTYSGATGTLSYSIGSTYPEYTKVAIYGASKCEGTTDNQLKTAACVERVGSELHVLTTEGTGILSGTVSLSCKERDMLFETELYIRLDIESKPEGALRAPIIMASKSSDSMILSIKFEPNGGKYNDEDLSTESTNSGFGYFTWKPTDVSTLNYRIYHSAEDVSDIILECPTLSANKVKILDGDTTNAVFADNTDFTEETDMLLEMLSGNCFFYMISRAFVNGELFGRATPFGQSYAVLTGQQVVPEFTSSIYARAVFHYDIGWNKLYTIVAHNVTDGDLAAINIKWGNAGNNGETLCTSDAAIFDCQLNSTTIMSVLEEGLYVEIETISAGAAEVRGQITENDSGSVSGGLSEGAIIAIAVVGAIVGVALIGAAGFFVYKKSTGFGTSKI